MKDELYKIIGPRVSDFAFDEAVASAFDDMVGRSVPMYTEFQRLVVGFGAEFMRGGVIYDVGCSTGTTIEALLRGLEPDTYASIVGIEPSAAMRDRATAKLAGLAGNERVSFHSKPIEAWTSLPGAQLITMLFSMQFVRPVHRSAVLRMFHESLTVGGVLLLGEKILADDSGLARLYIDIYHDYKRRAGYSVDEIARKREALENVLVPFREAENRMLLTQAGFHIVDQPFRWCNFALYLAMKV